MQHTIGERLQQARQRLGLSLDEIAGKLNIRKEILLKFEANEFDVRLPGIYVRGFFRCYVKFLKLDENALLEEYSSIVGDTNESMNNITLGHLQIENLEEKIKDEEPQITDLDSKENSAKFVKPNFQFVYFKWLIGLAVVLFAGLIISLCLPRKKASISLEDKQAADMIFEAQSAPTYEEITLVALDTVQVFVRQESDKRRLFSGTLEKDARQLIAKEDVLQISFTEGNNLLIERSDGTSIRPQKAGRGWIRVK